jgi:hypothetical protein
MASSVASVNQAGRSSDMAADCPKL